jgi:hypothetical protein
MIREKLVEMFVDRFLKFTDPIVSNMKLNRAKYYLVFESKVNTEPISEEEMIQFDQLMTQKLLNE